MAKSSSGTGGGDSNASMQVDKKTFNASKPEKVSAVAPRETYEVYSLRDRKETPEGSKTGSQILNEGIHYDKTHDVWRDNRGKKYIIRKKK